MADRNTYWKEDLPVIYNTIFGDVVTLMRFAVRYDSPSGPINTVLPKFEMGNAIINTKEKYDAALASFTDAEADWWTGQQQILAQGLENQANGTGNTLLVFDNDGELTLVDQPSIGGQNREAMDLRWTYLSAPFEEFAAKILETNGERLSRARITPELFPPNTRPSSELGGIIENSRGTGDVGYIHFTVNRKLRFAQEFNRQPHYVAIAKDDMIAVVFNRETGKFDTEPTDHVFGFMLDQGFEIADNIVTGAIAGRSELAANAMGRNTKAEKEAEERAKLERQRKAEQKFVEYIGGTRRRDRVSKRVTEETLMGKLPLAPHGTLSSRTWGIEVESGGARGVEAPKGYTRKGDGSLRSAYQGQTYTTFIEPARCPAEAHRDVIYEWIEGSGDQYVRDADGVAQTDEHGEFVVNPEYVPGHYGYRANPNYVDRTTPCADCGQQTVTASRDQGGDTAEFVSGILKSVHSRGLARLTYELSKNPQNDTAGVHVHVGVSDLNARQIGSLVYGYDRIEPLIEASYQREKREYCQLRSAQELLQIMRSAKTATSKDGLTRGERYVTLNLQALDAHGTVEFRAMGPVYDYDYLVRWAMFCREMVEVSKTATPKDWNRVNNWNDLMALFAKKGKEYKAAAFNQVSASQITEEITPDLVDV